MGVGTKLFSIAVEWSKPKGLKHMKIERQNINVQACRFYHNCGAVLGKIDEYAYL
jgi:Acetyltransferase (GNAT) family.